MLPAQQPRKPAAICEKSSSSSRLLTTNVSTSPPHSPIAAPLRPRQHATWLGLGLGLGLGRGSRPPVQGEAHTCEQQNRTCLDALGRCGMWAVACGRARRLLVGSGLEPCVVVGVRAL